MAHWTVSQEGRGLDLALEIHVLGGEAKDFELNVVRFASLGIPEYFAYAPRRGRLLGWRLPSPSARVYQPIVPQGGRWPAATLGVDLALEEGRLRFYVGSARLLDTHELIGRLSSMVDASTVRAEEEASRAAEAVRRADAETRRADEAAKRAERLAARLRELGVDPDE